MNEESDELEIEKTDEKLDTLTNVGLAGAASEVVQRFGSANKEFLVGYGGVDNESGQVLSKGLKSISQSKVNPDYVDNNIHQQAGFSAEVESNSRKNAEKIINKENTRNTRTDDIEKQKYGKGEIGGKNDQLYDHVELDANGNPIEGSATQLKFVGKGGNDTLSKLMSNKYDKYFDNDVPIEIPSDYYDSVREAAAKKADEVQKQIDRLKENKAANKEIIVEKEKQLKKLNDIKDGKSIRKNNVSSKEAEFARLHPELSTAKDIVGISHRAGLDAAKSGAVIAGSISIVRNIVAVVKGDKKPDEAALAVIKDTGTGTVISYTTAFAGSAIKGVMQNATNATIRTLSKTNLPGIIVTATLETGKTLGKYFKGEIDGVECLTELGEKGTGMVASAMFATIGQIAIPIPVVGGMIGGMVGYALSSACYQKLVSALNDAKTAREDRIRIEAECTQAIEMIREYRAEMEQFISSYMVDYINTFHTAFDDMKNALAIGNIDGFISGTNTITCKLGGKPQFNTFSEFNSLMESSESFKL
ncbi:hypothetical protein AGMMS50212_13620 [Spirochaetia bacterium]|nr:hypothetical protein AGMMS50212_13620 [Spirochaetia bacterium]